MYTCLREYKIMHYKQHYNWDCGISCVLMVLPNIERTVLLKNLCTICNQEEFYKSTWTIDLCYLLQRFKVDHLFYTITLGIHPEHKRKRFYEKIVSKDEERVNRKFCEAKTKGITIIKGSLPVAKLLEHLSKYGPIIILIDAVLLKCNTCKVNKISSEIQKRLPRLSSFHGHYIVLCGYDTDLGVIMYRDPAVRDIYPTSIIGKQIIYNNMVNHYKKIYNVKPHIETNLKVKGKCFIRPSSAFQLCQNGYGHLLPTPTRIKSCQYPQKERKSCGCRQKMRPEDFPFRPNILETPIKSRIIDLNEVYHPPIRKVSKKECIAKWTTSEINQLITPYAITSSQDLVEQIEYSMDTPKNQNLNNGLNLDNGGQLLSSVSYDRDVLEALKSLNLKSELKENLTKSLDLNLSDPD